MPSKASRRSPAATSAPATAHVGGAAKRPGRAPDHALRIARFHALQKELAKCDASGPQGRAERQRIEEELRRMGGLEAYQDDSLRGEKVGGETGKWLAESLAREMVKQGRAQRREVVEASKRNKQSKRERREGTEGAGQGNGNGNADGKHGDATAAITPTPPPAKRKRSSTDAATTTSLETPPSADEAAKRISELQAQLASTSDLNALHDLLLLCRRLALGGTEPLRKPLLRGVTLLTKAFESLLAERRLVVGRTDDEGMTLPRDGQSEADAAAQVAEWLRSRLNETVVLLAGLLGHAQSHVRLSALRRILALQVATSSAMADVPAAGAPSSASSPSTAKSTGRPAGWSQLPWRALMLALLAGPPRLDRADSLVSVRRVESHAVEPDVREAFADEALEKYDDVRFAFCRDLSDILASPPLSCRTTTYARLRGNAVSLLFLLTAVPTQQEHLNAFLVPGLASSAPPASKSKRTKAKAGKRSVGGNADQDEDDDDVEDEGDEDDDDMADWFSDSDDEARSGRKAGDSASGAAGLGRAAVGALQGQARRRRSRRPQGFHAAVHHLGPQRAAFSRAWLATLLPPAEAMQAVAATMAPGGATQLPLATTHEILVRLHKQILPHLVRPPLVADWLIDSLEAGGATSLLALNGLYTLMVSHNLNYPSFYRSLYALLASPHSPVLHVRYRSRFLRLLDVFLASTHLPASLVASFAKRLARLSLRAPPAAVAAVVPFVYNLLKRHKTCLVLVHREFGDRFDEGPEGVRDPFDAAEEDPLQTRALESSLWELGALGASLAADRLQGRDAGEGGVAAAADDDDEDGVGGGGAGGRSHYLASVTALGRALAEPMTRQQYDLEDFLDLTYATLFDTETKPTLQRHAQRRGAPTPAAKSVPALAHSLPRVPAGAAFEAFGTQRGRERLEAARRREREAREAREAAEAEGRRKVMRAARERDEDDDGDGDGGGVGAGEEEDDEDEEEGLDEEERTAREAMREVEALERSRESARQQRRETHREALDLVEKLWEF